MKNYTPDDILTAGDITLLTMEAYDAKRPASRRIKPLLAAAASIVLILGVLNADVIARGIQTILAYFSGVGALEATQDLLVQADPIRFTQDGFSYLIEGAYEQDGILHVPVLLTAERELTDLAARQTFTLICGQELRNGWSLLEYSEVSPALFWRAHPPEGHLYLYQPYVLSRFPQALSFAVFDVKFSTRGLNGPYTLRIEGDMNYYEVHTRQTGESTAKSVFHPNRKRTEEYLASFEAFLVLATPQEVDATVCTMQVEHGTLTALVSQSRDRVALYLAPSEETLASRTPRVYQLTARPAWVEGKTRTIEFIDDRGNAYEGVLRTTAAGNMPAPEYLLAEEPVGSIVGIRLAGLSYSMVPSDGYTPQIFKDYEPLDWYIPLE